LIKRKTSWDKRRNKIPSGGEVSGIEVPKKRREFFCKMEVG
jgi:hypothetical protein